VNWTKILRDAGIPESPGRPEVLKDIENRPYKKPAKAAKGKKKK
jgi:hypothetical protein|tara:strand:- start:1349 stop:1480 length:132 start_codon:yes stop_codon:yes gene_type:complete